MIPFEYQLNLFDAIGALVGAGSDQDQIAFLEVRGQYVRTVSGLFTDSLLTGLAKAIDHPNQGNSDKWPIQGGPA